MIKPVYEKLVQLSKNFQANNSLTPSLRIFSDLINSVIAYIENRRITVKKKKRESDLNKNNNNEDLADVSINKN